MDRVFHGNLVDPLSGGIDGFAPVGSPRGQRGLEMFHNRDARGDDGRDSPPRRVRENRGAHRVNTVVETVETRMRELGLEFMAAGLESFLESQTHLDNTLAQSLADLMEIESIP